MPPQQQHQLGSSRFCQLQSMNTLRIKSCGAEYRSFRNRLDYGSGISPRAVSRDWGCRGRAHDTQRASVDSASMSFATACAPQQSHVKHNENMHETYNEPLTTRRCALHSAYENACSQR